MNLTKLFFSVVPIHVYKQRRVIARSDLDYLRFTELAFLMNVDITHDYHRQIVGQHVVEENGSKTAVLPIYSDVPVVPNSVTVGCLGDPENPQTNPGARLAALESIAAGKKIDLEWGLLF